MAAWLAANTPTPPPPTPRMIEGRRIHERLQEILAELGYTDAHPLPPLASKRHPLIATPDAYSPSRHELIEVKTRARLDRIHRIQLAVYALIARENNIPVKHATLASLEDKRIYQLRVDPHLLQLAEKAIQATLETIHKPLPPPITQPPQKCRACRWRRHCPQRNPQA